MLQVREKSYSRLLKTHAPGIYLETRWYSFLRLPLEHNSCKGRFHLSVVCVLLPVFPFTVSLAQCCILRTEFPLQHILHVAQAFVQKLAHQIDDLLDQTS